MGSRSSGHTCRWRSPPLRHAAADISVACHYVYERVRDFLARRHNVSGHGTRRFAFVVGYEDLGLQRFERLP
jgi:hypothetical protein